MTKKYDALDAEILACIAAGRCKFADILLEVALTAYALIDKMRSANRLVDSRLQALRKRGVIEFQFGAREWVMA